MKLSIKKSRSVFLKEKKKIKKDGGQQHGLFSFTNRKEVFILERWKALCLLRAYKHYSKPTMPLSSKKPFDYFFMRSVYMRFLCDELAGSIQESELDPIVIVRKFRDDMDMLLSESENGSAETLTFAGDMVNCAEEILRYLKYVERMEEKNEDQKQNELYAAKTEQHTSEKWT